MASDVDALQGLEHYDLDALPLATGEEAFRGAQTSPRTSLDSVRTPLASTSALAPSQSTSSSGRTNPLTDLITTEKLYVEDLASIIKRVAAAWSRTNFPPAQLDNMFRAIEGVYRINKALLGKLTDIGPSPTSPKLLGDLLMRWIDELEPAYRKYSSAISSSFDDDQAVQSNPKLAGILASLPPVGSARAPEDTATLDGLFVLPYYRLRYYKKLYAKMLKSTQPGRSDHRLLVGANDKLDALVAACDESMGAVPPMTPQTVVSTEEERTPQPNRSIESIRGITPPPSRPDSSFRVTPPPPASSSNTNSFSSTGRSDLAPSTSQNTLASSNLASSSSTSLASASAPMHVEDLERRLDTTRTLDVFTMKPKKCRLQMQPANLGYQRSMRNAGEVHLSFVPASDPSGREVVVRHAHLFLLTDLFLVSEPVAAGEREDAAPSADFWLLFPPLAGKHLRAERIEGDELAFDIVVMKKERLKIRCETRKQVENWLDAFDACSQFGANALRVQTEPSGLRSPVLTASPATLTPASSTGRAPISPTGSNFSAQSDRLPPPRAFSTVSDPIGMRSRSAEPPEFLPPPPLRMNGAMKNGMNQSVRSERRSSLGPGSFPQSFPPPNHQNQSFGPPAGASGGYRGPSPVRQQQPAMPPVPPASQKNPRMNASISRRTDPGMMANGHLSASKSGHQMQRSRSADGLRVAVNGNSNDRAHYRAPSSISPVSGPSPDFDDEDDFRDEDTPLATVIASGGEVKSQIAAQMRCKVFLQQQRTQWKPIGTAKLRLYHQSPTNVKQLVVEQGEGKSVKPIISTIVLTDAVERVGKTGVAIELSDNGSRTGIIYMIQLKTEQSATGLFQQLLLGSDRTNPR